MNDEYDTIKEAIKKWLDEDDEGKKIRNYFHEIMIDPRGIYGLSVFISNHTTGYKNAGSFEINTVDDAVDKIKKWLRREWRRRDLAIHIQSNDPVNHPSHYCQNGLESIDVIKAFSADLSGEAAFCHGNAIKYILRFYRKNGREDLEKAKWYINRLEDILYGE